MVPEFTSMEEAVSFGIEASIEDVAVALSRREQHLKQCSSLLDLKEYDKALIEATKAQFYREMVEAHRNPERFKRFFVL